MLRRFSHPTPIQLRRATALLLVLAGCLAIGLAQPVQAGTVTVCKGCPFATITSGVAVATPGDTIDIGPGTYFENVDTNGKRLTFVGRGAGVTIVDGNGASHVFISAADITLSGLTVQNGHASDGGGGIYTSGTLTLTNVTVLSNTALTGAGALAQGNAFVSGGAFEGNMADANAGGLAVGGTLTMRGTDFIRNRSGNDSYAGGAHVAGAAVISGGSFEGNWAKDWGGALYGEQTLTVTGTQFVSNTAVGFGGAAYVLGDVLLSGALFERNATGGSGGALSIDRTLTATGTQFVSNMATSGVGGAALVVGDVLLAGALFERNWAGGDGGGLFTYASLTATGTTFISNTADTANGGGVMVRNDALLTGGSFEANQAGLSGGGLAGNPGRSLVATAIPFIANTAGLNGGAIYAGGTAPGRLVNLLLARNHAGVSGAALYLFPQAPLDLLFTTIASPTVGSAAAIALPRGTLNITGTIIANYPQGITRTLESTVTSDYNLFYNAPTGVPVGSHSITATDPLFVDPAGDNYRLRVNSPAAGKGIEAGVTSDLDGTPRATPPTIGAYEAQVLALALAKTAATAGPVAFGRPVTYTVAFSTTGTASDPYVVVTDVLPAGTTFATWVLAPPAGTLQSGNTITWTGPLSNGTALTLAYAVTNTAPANTPVINTAWLSGTLLAGTASAAYNSADQIYLPLIRR